MMMNEGGNSNSKKAVPKSQARARGPQGNGENDTYHLNP